MSFCPHCGYWQADEKAPDQLLPWQAFTVHKAQGSQWDHIVLFDESWAFRDYRDRWLYTAITRAAEQLAVVR